MTIFDDVWRRTDESDGGKGQSSRRNRKWSQQPEKKSPRPDTATQNGQENQICEFCSKFSTSNIIIMVSCKKKKKGGIIPVFSLLNVWVGVIVNHFSNNIIGWKMTNKNQGNLYIALLPFTYPIWNWNQAHDLHIKFWMNWGIIEIWLDHWAIQFTFTCGYTIFPALSDSRFSPGTTKAPIISVNPKSY